MPATAHSEVLDSVCKYLCQLQRKHVSSFRLEVCLLIPNKVEVSEAASHAKQIECVASGLLTNYGVSLSIFIQAVKVATKAPPPAVLGPLAPFLSSIDIYSIPREQTTCKHQLHTLEAAHSAFTPAHIAALQHYSSNLSALCISEFDLSRRVPLTVPLADSMADIAQLTGLTKLHLTLDNFSQLVDFQPLSQLSFLKDLALHCLSGAASCPDVLESSRDTLCHVSLASISWSLDTYHALQQIRTLNTLILKLFVLSALQANALAGITAGFAHLHLHQLLLLPDQPLLNLSAANPPVHEMTLWNMDDTSCQQLGSLPSLRTLTIVNSPLLAGTSFNTQPNLTELTFVNCPRVKPEGMQHILKTAMPACKQLALQCWGGQGTANRPMAHAGKNVFSGGKKLVSVDLCGVRGLRYDYVEEVRSALEGQQALGRAEPVVMLHVPFELLFTQCQSSGLVFDCMHSAPFLVKSGFWTKCSTLECNINHKKRSPESC